MSRHHATLARSFCAALFSTLFGLGAASCGDSPTSPGGGTAAAITSVSPESPVASAVPQVLTVQGGNFQTGLSVFVIGPDGADRVFSGAAIQDLQPSSFQVTVLLPQSGVHELRVGPSLAGSSAPFQFIVRATQTTPVIFSVTPTTAVRGLAPQPLRFTGLAFDPGLRVTLTAPDGSVAVLTGPQLSAISPTSVEISPVFATAGLHTFVITNPSGESSNPVQVSVQ